MMAVAYSLKTMLTLYLCHNLGNVKVSFIFSAFGKNPISLLLFIQMMLMVWKPLGGLLLVPQRHITELLLSGEGEVFICLPLQCLI